MFDGKCFRCEGTLEQPADYLAERAPYTGQYEDVLEIRLIGGYSMFFDSDIPVRILFCGVCAQQFMQENPEIDEAMMKGLR